MFHEVVKEKGSVEENENNTPNDEVRSLSVLILLPCIATANFNIPSIACKQNEKKEQRNVPTQNHNSRKKQSKNKKFPKAKKPQKKVTPKKADEVAVTKDEDSENENADDEQENKSDAEYNSDDEIPDNDKDDWEVKMEKQQKEYLYGDETPTSPLVHCPYFPEVLSVI